MFTRFHLAILTYSIVLSAGPSSHAKPGKTPSKAKAKVQLVSSVKEVIPGQPFDVALDFQLVEGWHIYWQNSGDSGQPPRVKWSLPSGFTAGDLRYPIPKRIVTGGTIVTNILEDEPVLPVQITPPPAIKSENVTLSAAVRYLICQETCLIETTRLKLVLPVQPSGDKATAAHEALFRRAYRALPKRSSRYLSVAAVTRPTTLTPGASFDLLVNIAIHQGYHIQSHTPLNPDFIKCELFLHRIDGVFFREPVFPPPKMRAVPVLGKVSEYVGRITVRVAGEVDAEAPSPLPPLGGVLKFQACNDKGTCFPPEALAFVVTHEAVLGQPDQPTSIEPADVAASTGLEGFLQSLGVGGQLFICFLYGMLINITPCVLPLLSIKVLSFVQQAHESRSRTLLLGLAFGAGVMVFFVVLGLLASQGKNVLQYPAAVITLGTVVMVMALSMLGVFTLQVPTSASRLEASIHQEGVVASFGKGALAPVLGFACTAPMMAGGFAWATQQTANLAVLAFLFMGLGMAFPYMLLGANPKWLSFLPKPGTWMITFERLMGFLLLGLVVLLLHPLITQIGSEGLEWTLVFLVMVSIACWLLGQIQITMPTAQRWRYRGGAFVLLVISVGVIYGWVYPLNQARPEASHGGGLIAWQPWSPEAVRKAVTEGHPVFVDVTAAYCTNCKVNKAVAINTSETADALRKCGMAAFRADFTKGDPQIFESLLQRFGRAGPPLDLIYHAGDVEKPEVLDVTFSKSYLLNKLSQACAPQTTASATAYPSLAGNQAGE